jgi:hypothetical protein
MPTTRLLVLFFCLAWLVSACDRPFRDVGEATVEVVSPDVTEAQDQDRIELELRVTSVRDVTSVRTGEVDFAPTGAVDVWRASLDLAPGLNRFLIETQVDDGPVGIDTVDVLRISWSVTSRTPERWLLSGVGSHSATTLTDGSTVIIGGSFRPGGSGGFDAWTLPAGGNSFRPARNQSVAPRVGHSATLLPDGRILLLGGGSSGNVEEVNQLVATAELYDPANESFTEIPVAGDPIRRMYHTAVLRVVGGSTFVVLLGGRGDTQYTPAPSLGIRQDMRTFELRHDSLFARSPAVGPFIRSMAGHTQVPLDLRPPGESDVYLVSGVDFDQDFRSLALTMDFDAPAGIDVQKTTQPLIPRIRHASVALGDGIVAHFGGRNVQDDSLVESGEIHVAAAGRSFRFPAALSASLPGAWGLSASRLPDGSILLVGGFDADGTALDAVDFVSLGLR